MSQHGADSHAWDPLAHLRVTTTAMREAARLVDAVAHRWASGRWLATGGGGYDAYRVVPRTWALTWLAGAHREPDEATPAAWRDRWADEAGAFGTPGMPTTYLDAPNAGQPVGHSAGGRERGVPADARARPPGRAPRARPRGGGPWMVGAGADVGGAGGPRGPTTVAANDRRRAATDAAAGAPAIRSLTADELSRLTLAPRTVPPFDPADALAILCAAAADGARVVGAIAGDVLVGAAVAAPASVGGGRRAGSSRSASRPRTVAGASPARSSPRLVAGPPGGDGDDGIGQRRRARRGGPARHGLRIEIAGRLLRAAGFELGPVSPDVRRDDPWAIEGRLPPR